MIFLTQFYYFNLILMLLDLGLPQMDSKDVEDIFKDVLSPDNLNEQSSLGSTGMPRGPQQSPAHGSQPSRPPSLPPQTSIHLPGPSTPSSVPSIGSPFSIPPPSPYPSEYSRYVLSHASLTS